MAKLVMYLSGRTMSADWHREQDSVAVSVTIPKAIEAEIERSLLEYCEMEEEDDKLPWVGTGALDDFFSDVEDNGPDDPRYVIAAAVREMCRSECDCGFIHYVKGKA
jgi:hypothetical protein